MRNAVRAALLIAASLGLIAAAIPRHPTEKWVVNFSDAQCVASRNYGTKENPLFLVIKLPPLGDVIQIGVTRAAKGGREPRQLNAEFAIDQSPPLRTSMLAFGNEQKERVYLINLPIPDFAPVRTAKVVSIKGERDLNERFAITALGPLMKVMDQCVADLRKVWNISGSGLPAPTLQRGVVGDLRGVLKSGDYPTVAVRSDQSGSVNLALLIDEQGKIADCTVIETSGVASLDAQACILLRKRARLEPAIGLDGKPAKGSFLQRITWRVE